MSPEDQEASRTFLVALWNAYQADVTTARHLSGTALQHYADDIGELLAEPAATPPSSRELRLVDELLPATR